jgi:pyrimidine operon attenuation protein / uracil phosphoribosyltransferase
MIILTHEQIERKIKRIAYQIYEQHVDSKGLVIAGIATHGYVLAEKIAGELKQVSPLNIRLAKVEVVKENPGENTTKITFDGEEIKGQNVVIVDDVLNTARTMVYAIYPFFKAGAATIKTAVLADRNHKNYPVSADFTGISLATTLQEHITFEVNSDGSFQLSLN